VVQVKATVAALLEPEPTAATEAVRKAPLNAKPYWDLERARIENTRKVPVELVVNGKPVAKQEITADGKEQEVKFEVSPTESCWMCLRVLPSSHTNPVWVTVGDKPVRASKKSAQWCLDAIDRCWTEKTKSMRKDEQADARAAYDKAREEYKKILEESRGD
jgi:hypothetical protein